MTKHSLLQTDVKLDGKRLTVPGDVSFEVSPIEVDVPTVDSVYQKTLYLHPEANGSITFRAPADDYANDPLDFIDALGFRQGYFAFDDTTETVLYTAGPYDMFDETSGTYGVPVIPIEIRQVQETTHQSIDDGGTYTKIAIKFKAGFTKLKYLSLLLHNDTAQDTDTCSAIVCADSAGTIGSQVGSTTVTINFSAGTDGTPANNVYTGSALAQGATYSSSTWKRVSFDTVDILGGQSLTFGNDYWIVITAPTGDEPIFFNITSNHNLEQTDVKFYNGSWVDVAGMTDPCFVLGGYNTTGGDVIEIKSWNSARTEGIGWTFSACKVRIGPPKIDPKKDIEVTITFRANIVTGPTSL